MLQSPYMKTDNKKLEQIAKKVRRDIITMIYEAQSGHPAGSLSMTDLLVALYFSGLTNLSPAKRHDPHRDRVVLSNAHTCPALYAVLARKGYFPLSELKTLRKLGSRLQGHSNNHFDIGIETSGGPLGQGISQAIGIALAGQIDKLKYHTWCFLGDGEMDEGQVWEALMFIGKNKLHNLTTIIDRNHIQIDGRTDNVMPLEDLQNKLQSFNLETLIINGHSYSEIKKAYQKSQKSKKPVIIIAQTIAGKGVSFMENDFHWHGQKINAEHFKLAMQEL